MQTAYIVCATVGGAIFLIQLVMQLMGLDHDADADFDVDHDFDHADSSLFFGILSFRAVVAGVMFYGLAGLAAAQAQQPDWTGGVIAAGSGVSALVVMGLLMNAMKKMQSSGTLDIRHAVAQPGVVYLTVPAGNAGAGKVTVTVQGRSSEFPAMTPGTELLTGAKIVVTRVLTADTLEVTAAPSQEV